MSRIAKICEITNAQEFFPCFFRLDIIPNKHSRPNKEIYDLISLDSEFDFLIKDKSKRKSKNAPALR